MTNVVILSITLSAHCPKFSLLFLPSSLKRKAGKLFIAILKVFALGEPLEVKTEGYRMFNL
jgi:hypothetical protein